MRVIWSDESKYDLAQIWEYLFKNSSAEVADRHIRTIESACRKLSQWPLAGRARDRLAPGLRSLVVAPYVVFYRVGKTAVEVVRVLDGRRNLSAVLSGDL